MVHTLLKDYIKYNRHTVGPVHILASGSGRTGKSNLVKITHKAISKEFLYNWKDLEKTRVLLLGSIGISSVNIGGTTVHSGPEIKTGTM